MHSKEMNRKHLEHWERNFFFNRLREVGGIYVENLLSKKKEKKSFCKMTLNTEKNN